MTDLPPKIFLVVSNDPDRNDDTKETGASNLSPESVSSITKSEDEDHIGAPSIDLPAWLDWFKGIAVGPCDEIGDMIHMFGVSALHYLPWRERPDGTRTHSIEGVGDQARIDFYCALYTEGSYASPIRTPFRAEDFAAATALALRATRDRFLIAAATVAHGGKVSLADFPDVAAKAYAFTEPKATEEAVVEGLYEDAVHDIYLNPDD